MISRTERLTEIVIKMLQRSRPVPLDFIYRLVEAGVDYSTLEHQYAA